MKQHRWVGMGIAVAGLAFLGGCTAEVENVGSAGTSLASDRPACFTGHCVPETTPIIAGRHIEIGTAGVVSVGDELVITLDTRDGWTYDLVHIYAGTGPVPANGRGIPVPGRFPHHYSYDDPTWTDEIRIPIDDIACGEALTIAIHMEAQREGARGRGGEETAWAFGEPFPGPRWGWYLYYDICCAGDECVVPPEFWRDNPDDWPPYIEKLGMGGNLYYQPELIDLLSLDPTGDASVRLAQSWIGLKLNWYCGVDVSDDDWNAMLSAGSWFYRNKDADGRLPYGVDPLSPEGLEAIGYAAMLEAFNAGESTAPMCPPELYE